MNVILTKVELKNKFHTNPDKVVKRASTPCKYSLFGFCVFMRSEAAEKFSMNFILNFIPFASFHSPKPPTILRLHSSIGRAVAS